MPNPEIQERIARHRREVEAFWNGNQDEPLVLLHNGDYCPCDVLTPTRRSLLRDSLRALTTYLVLKLPFSAPKKAYLRALGMKIGRNVYIAPDTMIDPLYPWLVELEDDVLLGNGCRLITHEYTAATFRIGRVRVGRGSVIGAYATVRSGVTIGRKVTVGFNSYVNRDVPDGLTVGGVPARPLGNGAGDRSDVPADRDSCSCAEKD